MKHTYEVSQADIILPPNHVLLSPAMRHVLAIRLSEMDPKPPSRLGGIEMLFLVLELMYEGKVRNADGSTFKIHESIVDKAYGECGGGADGRWHTDALKWARQWPPKGIQKRHLLRIKLWYVFFASISKPLDLEVHRYCEICEGQY